MNDTLTTPHLTAVPPDYELPKTPDAELNVDVKEIPITLHHRNGHSFKVANQNSWAWADGGLIFATGRWSWQPTEAGELDILVATTSIEWIELHYDD